MSLVLVCQRGFTSYNYVTCKNVISRRIVMVASGVTYDIIQSAPRGSPLLGAERLNYLQLFQLSYSSKFSCN